MVTSPAVNNTFLSLGILLGWTTSRHLTVTQTKALDSYQIVSNFGGVNLIFDFDMGYVLDGIPIVTGFTKEQLPLDLEDGTGGFLGVDAAFDFCEPNTTAYTPLRRWNHYYYDPSLSVVFGSVPNPSSPKNTKAQKTVWPIAVGVSLGVVLIIIILVLLVVFVRPIRNAIMPYNKKRVDRARDRSKSNLNSVGTEMSESSNPRWTSAAKPPS